MMGFLAPWFVVAGVAAITLPVLFHMLRRTPRGRMPFSAMMFLMPSPPRITSRSRLENWPLLLLRATVLALLALAFGRPFLRQWLEQPVATPQGERVALLIDTSASMRRGDLWRRAQRAAAQIVERVGPHDELAIIAFDAHTETVLPFELWRSTPHGERSAMAQAALDRLAPSWSATWLDSALIAALETLDTAGHDRSASSSTTPDLERPERIVLVSDLQSGSRTAALQNIEWPQRVSVEIIALPQRSSNAAVHGLDTGDDPPVDGASRRPRVLLSNAGDSSRESFTLGWDTAAQQAAGSDYYVPPGQTRVVRAPPLVGSQAAELVLRGDDEPFDNHLWLVLPTRQRLRVLHLAAEAADDQHSLRYFLERALGQVGSDRAVTVETVDPYAESVRVPRPADLGDVALVVVTGQLTFPAGWNEALTTWIQHGGVALAVLGRAEDAAWRGLLPAELAQPSHVTVTEAEQKRDYRLLAEIDRQHPLFAPFADPRYADFTKIRFWRHRKIALDDIATKQAHILARFDSGDPAVVELPRGKGRLLLLAAGWQPKESQLGVSSKFVPLLSTLVDLGWQRPTIAAHYETGETIDLAAATSSAGPWTIRTPVEREVVVPAGSSQFTLVDGPGVYQVRSSTGEQALAVNLEADESKTSPLAPEALEALGVRRQSEQTPSAVEALAAQRQTMQVRDLESRQQGWRWLLLSALAVAVVETVVAGRFARREHTA